MSDKSYCSSCHAKSEYGEPLEHIGVCAERWPEPVTEQAALDLNHALNSLRFEVDGKIVDDIQAKILRVLVDIGKTNKETVEYVPDKSTVMLERVCAAAKALVAKYGKMKRVFELDIADFREALTPILNRPVPQINVSGLEAEYIVSLYRTPYGDWHYEVDEPKEKDGGGTGTKHTLEGAMKSAYSMLLILKDSRRKQRNDAKPS